MDKLAYSIPAFCAAHSISRAMFYVLLKDGRAPAVMKLGRRTLIASESAAEWRARITTATASQLLSDEGRDA